MRLSLVGGCRVCVQQAPSRLRMHAMAAALLRTWQLRPRLARGMGNIAQATELAVAIL